MIIAQQGRIEMQLGEYDQTVAGTGAFCLRRGIRAKHGQLQWFKKGRLEKTTRTEDVGRKTLKNRTIDQQFLFPWWGGRSKGASRDKTYQKTWVGELSSLGLGGR